MDIPRDSLDVARGRRANAAAESRENELTSEAASPATRTLSSTQSPFEERHSSPILRSFDDQRASFRSGLSSPGVNDPPPEQVRNRAGSLSSVLSESKSFSLYLPCIALHIWKFWDWGDARRAAAAVGWMVNWSEGDWWAKFVNSTTELW